MVAARKSSRSASPAKARTKSWRAKLETARGLPKVEPIPAKLRSRWGKGTLVIPAPIEVDALMRKVPFGKLVTIRELRAVLAEQHGATLACPITTGIFAWIAAHAAEEGKAQGEADTTPYWRTLKADGELNPKYPSGLAVLRTLLEAEGHEVTAKGKRMFVVDHESALVKPAALRGRARRRAAAARPGL